MINVNQITAQLARMRDPALQQYAQMHKDDPYTLSLALAESNRRKQTRQAAQMQAQEQPKVVDQELQNMAAPMPEDVGIAQLPTGDMNYAEGGIVAFSDGGDVPRYNGSQGSLLKGTEYDIPGMMQSDLYAKAVAKARADTGRDPTAEDIRKALAFVSAPFAAAADVVTSPLTLLRRGLTMPLSEAAANPPSFTPAMDMRNAYLYGNAAKEATDMPSARARLSDGDLALRRQPALAAAPAAAPDTGARGPSSRLPAGPTAPAAPGAAPAAAAAPNLDAAALMDTALKQAEGAKHPYAQELGEIGQAKVKAAEEKVAGLEAIQKQFSDIYKGRKERLDTKEAELSKLKDQGMGLAFLQAGAAMMSTPGSFGTALGESVKVGTKQYAAGLDKLRAAQDKLSDARDRLEEIEAQRGELSARELFKARSEVKDIGIGAREDLIKANMQMYGLKREEAIKRVDLQIKVGLSQFEQGEQTKRSVAEQRGQTQRAQIAAGAQQNFYEALGKAAPDSPLAKGYASAKEADKIPRLYGEYTKLVADPMNGSAFEQKYPTFEAFLSAMGGGRSAGFVKPPANAPVLRAPGT